MRKSWLPAVPSGIGGAAVDRFAAAGDRVWFTYRLVATGPSGSWPTRRAGRGRGVPVRPGRVGVPPAVAAELPGQVDVLVNNAAVARTVEYQVTARGRAGRRVPPGRTASVRCG